MAASLCLSRAELESCAWGSIPLNTGGLIENRCQVVGVKYRHFTKCQPFPWAMIKSSLLILSKELGKRVLDVLVEFMALTVFQSFSETQGRS